MKTLRGWRYRCEQATCRHMKPMNAGAFVNHGRGPEHRMHHGDIHDAMEVARDIAEGRAIRLDDVPNGDLPDGRHLGPITYWKTNGGTWFVNFRHSGLGNLSAHDVTEHEDGTITVSPSILLTSPGFPSVRRHGFLVRGVWQPCGDDRPEGRRAE